MASDQGVVIIHENTGKHLPFRVSYLPKGRVQVMWLHFMERKFVWARHEYKCQQFVDAREAIDAACEALPLRGDSFTNIRLDFDAPGFKSQTLNPSGDAANV